MEIIQTEFEGLVVLQPKIYTDKRGAFLESWNQSLFKDLGLDINFVQDNQSISHKNVLRGLHFQQEPNAQGKLVRVTRGSAMDVVVDLRTRSTTYGKHFKLKLCSKKSNMMWIPSGFAHGFLALEDNTVFQYKCDAFYAPNSEECLKWNDPSLEIDWGITSPFVSEKDQLGKLLSQIKTTF